MSDAGGTSVRAVISPSTSDRSREVPPRERAGEQRARTLQLRGGAGGQRVKRRTVCAHELAHRIARHIEHHLKAANTLLPQRRQEICALDVRCQIAACSNADGIVQRQSNAQ